MTTLCIRVTTGQWDVEEALSIISVLGPFFLVDKRGISIMIFKYSIILKTRRLPNST